MKLRSHDRIYNVSPTYLLRKVSTGTESEKPAESSAE